MRVQHCDACATDADSAKDIWLWTLLGMVKPRG
jgi:hypothetical protein